MPSDSRARLIAYLCQAGLSNARANAVLDDYTHGLAERIRAEKGSGTYEPAQLFRGGMDYAADLIDFSFVG